MKLVTTLSIAVAVVAIVVGLVLGSDLPKRLGVYRWLAALDKTQIGLTPAHHYGIPWGYTWEELYASNLTGQSAIVTGGNSGYGIHSVFLVLMMMMIISGLWMRAFCLVCCFLRFTYALRLFHNADAFRIGYEIALALTQLGAQVTMTCRNPARCEAAADKIRRDPNVTTGEIITAIMDTSSLASVKSFAEDYIQRNNNIDMLYLNAGSPLARITEIDTGCVPLSVDGIERIFATNYVGHHLLFRLLERHLAPHARIVSTSSTAALKIHTVATDLETLHSCSDHAKSGKKPLLVGQWYAQSKLAQIVWTKALTRRQQQQQQQPDDAAASSSWYVNAFHPGMVATSIWQDSLQDNVPWLKRTIAQWLLQHVFWQPREGALTGLYLGVQQAEVRGKYFHPIVQEVIHPAADNITLQDALWEFSNRLVQDFLVVVPAVEEAE